MEFLKLNIRHLVKIKYVLPTTLVETLHATSLPSFLPSFLEMWITYDSIKASDYSVRYLAFNIGNFTRE